MILNLNKSLLNIIVLPRRIINLIDPEKVAYGGKSDETEKYIEPTIIIDATDEDKCMKEESLGIISSRLHFISFI